MLVRSLSRFGRTVFHHGLTVLVAIVVAVGMTACTDSMPTQTEPAISGESASEADQPVKAGKTSSSIQNFVAPLSGEEVVPPVDTDARGLAKFKLNKAGDELSFKLNVANIEEVIGAHIHMAPAGDNGGIVVFLFGDPFADPVTVNGTLAEGSITASDVIGSIAEDFDALVEAMKNGNAYVQVHTLTNQPGEIRGQIDHGNGMIR